MMQSDQSSTQSIREALCLLLAAGDQLAGLTQPLANGNSPQGHYLAEDALAEWQRAVDAGGRALERCR